MKIKNCFFALSAAMLLFPLVACNKSSVTWDVTEEKLEKVQHLNAHIINSTADLSFTLSSDDLTFNPETLSKDAIVLLADFDNPNNLSLSVTNNDKESGYDINVSKLLANRFTDFIYSLSKDNKIITITIPEQYKNGTFFAFINDKVTSSGNFAESSQIFIPVETEEALMFQEDYCSYFLGQKNPCFYFNIHKANSIYDKEKITFGGDFEDLKIADIMTEEHEDHYDITLITEGSVKSNASKNSNGTVTFEAGFVDNLKSDATFKYEVATGNAYVNPIYIQRDDTNKKITVYVAFSHSVGSNMQFSLKQKEEAQKLIKVVDAKIDPESDDSGYYVTLKYDHDSFKEAMVELRSSTMKVIEKEPESNAINNAISYEVVMDFTVPEFYVTLDVGEDGCYCFDVELCDGFINNSSDSLYLTKENIEFVRGLDGDYSPTFNRGNITKIEKIYHHNVSYGFEISTDVKYDTKHDYISGNLIISKSEVEKTAVEPSIKYHSACGEEYEIHNLSLPYSFETLEVYKRANGRVNKYNISKKDPTAEYYTTVMQPDDFCWQYGVKAGINGLVLGGLTGAAINGSGDAAAALVGIGLEIIDGLLDGSMGYDPIQQLFDALTTITLQLNEISKNLQEMRSEMHEMHEEVYNGISTLNFVHEQTAWTDFCKTYLEPFDTIKLDIRNAIKSKIYDLFSGSSNQTVNLVLNYGNLNDSRTKDAPYASLVPSYTTTPEGKEISTDKITIDSDRKIEIEIDSSKFINTKTILQNGYNRDFIKELRKDLAAAIETTTKTSSHEFDPNKGLTIKTGKDSYNSYYNNCYKDTTDKSGKKISAKDNLQNAFAGDVVKTLIDQGIKDYFKRGEQTKAENIAKQARTCFRALSGEIGVGAEKQYEHFYKMMYGKYSFQNEAMPSIKRFRMWLKQIMFRYASIAKTGLDVYNNSATIGLIDELKESYQFAIEDFCKNDGLKDVKKNVYDKNETIFSADYCYVTNCFVTMSLLKNRTTDCHTDADKPKNSKVGISSQNWVYEKKNSIGVYRKLNDKQGEASSLPYVSSLKMKHIVDRARYNGNLKNEKGEPITVEQYFLKFGVLANMVYDEHNEHDANRAYLINEYSGAYEAAGGRAKDYKRDVTVYCHTKLAEKMHYFELDGSYNVNKDPHDKKCEYGTIYKTHAKIWDINNNSAWQTPDRDNLGHVYWHFQSHWYWRTDEIWGFQEFTAPTYYYTFLKC